MSRQRNRGYHLTNITIYDGTGKPAFTGDILIQGSTILSMGNATSGSIPPNSIPENTIQVDCQGLAAAPGFIDMHSHSDSGLPLHPEAECLIRQGITTTVGGNCGSSAAGISQDDDSAWNKYLEAGLAKWNGLDGYLETIEKIRPAVNIAMLTGHGDLRRQIVGDSGRPLTCEEKEQMRSLAERAMSQGAFGISSGLEYVPGRFADIDELAYASLGVVPFNGIHASHIRNEGPMLLESIKEIEAVTEKSNVRFEVSHLKACGPENWGKVRQVLDMFGTAKARGLNISCDFYPYLASSTGLSIVLPDWVLQNGKNAALALLEPYGSMPGFARDIAGTGRNVEGSGRKVPEPGSEVPGSGNEVPVFNGTVVENKIAFSERAKQACAEADTRTLVQGGWDKIVITSVTNPDDKWMEGLNVQNISCKLESPPSETAMGILVRNHMNVGIVRHAMSEDDLIAVMQYPHSCVVTDGSVSIPAKGKIHPRSIGTYPRLLGRYVRELGILPMEEAVRKCTSLPARKLGLHGRGLLAEGYTADLAIFDPDKIADKSTYQDPWQYPVGIFAVFVNGQPVIWEGEVTGNRPGQALRRV